MKDKKGQDISITTIILVVLGIAVLVLLILGFTKGWNNFLPWLSGNNADTIQGQCQAACATNSKYEFCSSPKILTDGKEKIKTTCYELATGIKILSDSTLPTTWNKYGISTCTGMPCP